MVNRCLPGWRCFGSVALLGLAALLATGCSDDGSAATGHGSAGEEQGPGGTSAAGGTGGGKGTGGNEGMLGGSAGTMTQTGGTGGDGSAVDAAADANGSRDAGNPDAPPAHYNHRVLVGTSHQGPISIIADDGTIEWQYDYTALDVEANDPWMLPNGDIVFPYVKGAQQLTKDKKVVWNYPAPSGSEIQSAVPLENGHFLIGETHGGGIGYLRELDSMGKVLSSVTVDSGNSGLGTHGQWRAVRKTPQGTYLVTYIDLGKGRELDANGNKIREFPCGNFVAIRLPNLNTLLACGDSTRVIEVDPQDKNRLGSQQEQRAGQSPDRIRLRAFAPAERQHHHLQLAGAPPVGSAHVAVLRSHARSPGCLGAQDP